jgi:hypothetical protein
MVRAGGALSAFYRAQAPRMTLTPAGAAWVDYDAPLVRPQARDHAGALTLAREGFNGMGDMRKSAAFYELAATVYRGQRGEAAPLYQKVVAADRPGGGIG